MSTPVSPVASVMLDGVAVSRGQVWVDGESDSPSGGRPIIEHFQNGHWSIAHLSPSVVTDNNEVLMLRGVGGHWSVDPAPDPGSGSNTLGGITAVRGQLWAAGVYDTGGSTLPLIEHR